MSNKKYLLFLFPLQVLALPVGTTKFDIFPIFVFISIIIFTLGGFEKKMAFNLTLFIILSLTIKILLNYSPDERFLSALFWILILIATWHYSYKFYDEHFFKLLIFIGYILVLVIYFQFFILKDYRPKAFFLEPSTAGLVMYSYSLIYLIQLLFFNQKKVFIFNLINFGTFFFSGYLTQSSHITLIFIIPLVFLAFSILKLKFRTIFFGGLIGTVIIFLAIINNEHLLNRLDLNNEVKNLNLSQLSWLRGLDQALFSVKKYPFSGFGIGSTGSFEFTSEYGDALHNSGYSDLNLKDGYSLLFRLIIEVGLVPTIILILFFIHFLKTIVEYMNLTIEDTNLKLISLYIFGISLFIGSLIKEPSYACSPLFISIMSMGIASQLKSQNKHLLKNKLHG